jgi:GTP-binding protein
LHLIDVQPFESQEDPVEAAQKIIAELEKWDEGLEQKPRWLVLNKVDRLAEEATDAHCQDIIDRLGWRGRVFKISALRGDGLRELTFSIMDFLQQRQADDEE